MAILSFAHLKNKKSPDHEEKAPIAPSRTIHPVRNQRTGVMSFAHLRGKKTASTMAAEPINEEETKNSEPRLFRIPAVMQSALLVSVNYCQGCGRFLPGNETRYGHCLREGEINSTTEPELWKVIPDNAPVSRCFFNIKI